MPRQPSNRKGALHLGGLELSLGTFPMAVDVRRHLERGVPQVPREPGALCAALTRALCERVPEAVERSLLLRGPNPPDLGAGQGGVKVAPKQNPLARGSRNRTRILKPLRGQTRLNHALATGHSTVDVLGETPFQSGGSSSSGRSRGSEAGVLPAPLLAVAGAGGIGSA